MIPRFSLDRPGTLEEAFDAFATAGGDAAYIAGGTELLQVMKMGFAQFDTLIDLKRIADLQGVSIADDGSLWIGAATTHREIEQSQVVRTALPALSGLEREVANVRVRNTGTLGGNLAFAEPHSDPATLLVACGATIRLAGRGGSRTLPMDEFVVGPLVTAREDDEILVGVSVPARGSGEGRGYAKLAFFERPAASVGVRLTVEGGAISSATVAVGSIGEVPEVVERAGSGLVGVAARPDALAARVSELSDAFAAVDAVQDLNGSPDYKRHLAAVLTRQAAQAAVEEAARGV